VVGRSSLVYVSQYMLRNSTYEWPIVGTSGLVQVLEQEVVLGFFSCTTSAISPPSALCEDIPIHFRVH
jgi:hypothetical protein